MTLDSTAAGLRHSIRRVISVFSLAALGLPLAGQSAMVNIGSGNSADPTYYRSLALTWNSPNGTGPIDGNDIFGESYTGNFVSQAVNASANINRTGSTLTGRSQGAPIGYYASSNYAEINVSNAQAGNQYYAVGGAGSKTVLRVEDPSALAERATFNWSVTGDSSIPAGILGTATSRLDFGYSTDIGSDWFDLFANPSVLNAVTELGPGDYSFTVPLQISQPLYVHFWSSAFAQVDPGQAPVGSNFSLIANFHSTFVLQSVQVFDTDDIELTEWSLYDEESNNELFNHQGRIVDVEIPPDLPATAVPLPATGWMLLTAIGAVVARTKRFRPRYIWTKGAGFIFS